MNKSRNNHPNAPDAQSLECKVMAMTEKRTIFRARDLAAAGIPNFALTRLVAAGKLERVARDVYARVDAPLSAYRSLAEVSFRVPGGVICLLSALRYHEIGTQSPHDVWVAIPPGSTRPTIQSPRVRFTQMAPVSITAGVQSLDLDGVPVKLFCPAKTVADCFKYRNKVGLDVALEALRDAWEQRLFTIDELWGYAKINRVNNVIRPYLEMLVA